MDLKTGPGDHFQSSINSPSAPATFVHLNCNLSRLTVNLSRNVKVVHSEPQGCHHSPSAAFIALPLDALLDCCEILPVPMSLLHAPQGHHLNPAPKKPR